MPIAPLPLVLDDDEYQQIAAGAAQRAAMLQLLFHDLFCSRQRVLDDVLDSSLVDRIIDLHGWTIGDLRAFWDGADLDAVRFIYGPDLIRDVDGRWLLLEDNIGCLGGVGNVCWVLEQPRRRQGCELRPVSLSPTTYAGAVEAFLTRAAVSDRRPDVVCLAGQAPLTAPDTDGGEERRKCRSMASAGLTTTTVEQAAASSVGCRTRPAAVVNLGGTLAPSLSQLLRSWHVDGGVPIVNGPGIGLVANKALLVFSDELVRFYLGQEPLLSPPTPRSSICASRGGALS